MVRLRVLSPLIVLLFLVVACDGSDGHASSSTAPSSEPGFVGNANAGGMPDSSQAETPTVSSRSRSDGNSNSENPIKENQNEPAQEEPGKALVTFTTGPPVEFLEPSGVSVVGIVSFKVATGAEVVRVEYLATGPNGNGVLELGTSESAQNGFAFSYLFLEGGERTVGVRAFNAAGAIVGTAWKGIYVGLDAGADAELTVTPDVNFITPKSGAVSNPVTFIAATQGNVSRVRYVADGLSGQAHVLGESDASSNGYYLTYLFNIGGPRTVRAQALNALGQVVSEDLLFLVVETNVVNGEDTSGTCAPGQLLDCEGDCANSSWLGDGYCDDGIEYPANFACALYSQDDGDCTPVIEVEEGINSSQCGMGYVVDCVGNCAKNIWIGDGFCDDGTQYNIDLSCGTYNNDEGDCGNTEGVDSSNCVDGQVLDCNGSCQNSNWIGDGVCDDGSQYAAVFTCDAHNQDGGDCVQPSNPEVSGGSDSVPYFYQYANQYAPGATCQNTSIAMLLTNFGWSGHPDDIYLLYGKDLAQSPAGLEKVFNELAATAGLTQRLSKITNGTIEGMRALIDQGQPVIVHGFFTGFGHVLVVTGYGNGSYTVNDPAGKWNQQFKGGYPYGYNASIGKGIKYPAGKFEQAVSTLNGAGFEPLWYYEVIDN